MPAPSKKKPTAKRAKLPAITLPANKFLASPQSGETSLMPLGPAAGDIARDGDVVRVTGRTYSAGTLPLDNATVFFIGSRHRHDGPARGEADKVAWQDPATGLECIIMRDPKAGNLRGFVGVPAGHPLFGYKHDAIPADVGIEVHGGLTYSAACDVSADKLGREARSICHVTVVVKKESYATSHRPVDDAWWFGFECNLPQDLLPDVHQGINERDGTRRTYRDDEYVANEVLNLAAQMQAIAERQPMPLRFGPPLPPLGMNDRAGREKKGGR
jgi:hypothetical protein